MKGRRLRLKTRTDNAAALALLGRLASATLALNVKDNATSKTPPFTLFMGRPAGAWEDYTMQELALKYGDPAATVTAAELQDARDDFEQNVRPAVRAAMNAKQDAANARLDGKRKLVVREFPEGALVICMHD